MKTVSTQLNVRDIMLTQADRRALEAIRTRNLQQFRGWTAQMETDVIRAVSDGVAAGESIDKIPGRISDAIHTSNTRARRIARTESINAAVEGARSRYRDYGIEYVEIIACDDWRTCKICQQHDGKVYSVDDDAHMPPYHPNCRCAIKAVVKKDKEKEPAKLRKKPEKRVPKVEPNVTSVNADRQIPDFSQMKTMSEIEGGLRATFGQNVIIEKGFSKLNPKAVAPGMNHMAGPLQDFPEACKTLTTISSETEGYASIGVSRTSDLVQFAINKRYYTRKGDDLKKVYDEYLESTMDLELPDGTILTHYHPIGTTFDDNPVHEAGHLVEVTLIKRMYHSPVERTLAWMDCTVSKMIFKEAKQELQREMGGRSPSEYSLILDLSRYAARKYTSQNDYSETMAEAFADYYANGERAKPISKKIIEVTKRKYNEVFKK